MSEDLVARYGARTAPRYTSHPTAADFTAAVGPAEHARWLGTLDPAEPVSIYIHVPYCREICAYCGCHAKAVRRDEPVAALRAALMAEIRLVADRVSNRLTIGRLAFGGGTPSILGVGGLRAVVGALGERFDVDPRAERSIELDPRFVDAALCDGLAGLGFNRVSLGVQDVEPRVQAAIGRLQPIETVQAAVRLVRSAGIRGLNLDLIYGLPHQSGISLARTCDAVIALGPDRVAAYGYAHLPQRRTNQRLVDASALPAASERFAQAATIAARFQANGYQAIGIDHYARLCDPLAAAARGGSLRRNFQGYTDDACGTLIGFGPSAVSQLPGGFAQNLSPIGGWHERIAAGELATARGHAATGDDRVRAAIIENLMCRFRAELGGDAPGFGDEIALLRPLVADGLVEVRDGMIAVTRAGRPFVRLVAAVFDRFRTEATATFSGAV